MMFSDPQMKTFSNQRWTTNPNAFIEIRIEPLLWYLLLMGMFCLLIAGCSLTVPNEQDNGQHKTDSAVAVSSTTPADIWTALAQAVRAKTINNTARLAQFVVVLARNGDLSEQDVAAFDRAFPQITDGSRDLTDADITTILDLRKKGKS